MQETHDAIIIETCKSYLLEYTACIEKQLKLRIRDLEDKNKDCEKEILQVKKELRTEQSITKLLKETIKLRERELELYREKELFGEADKYEKSTSGKTFKTNAKYDQITQKDDMIDDKIEKHTKASSVFKKDASCEPNTNFKIEDIEEKKPTFTPNEESTKNSLSENKNFISQSNSFLR